jgi:hypothetical protein
LKLVDIVTSEADVWAALRVDLVDDGSSPTEPAPVDRDFIRSLIVAAEARLARFIGETLAELEYAEQTVPEPLTRAVILDVTVHYFNRLNAELPDDYDQAIAPYRVFGFGA